MQVESLRFVHEGSELQAHLALPGDGGAPTPAVLFCHAYSGQGPLERSKAERVAQELGVAGVALDVYGRGVLGQSPAESSALMAPFLADRAALRRRLLANLDAVTRHPRIDPARVVVAGFCFGGLCALDVARSGAPVAGVVSFHGLLARPAGLEPLPSAAKVLVLHGHDDPMVPPSQVLALEEELTAAGVDWQVHVYGGVKHAFTNPQANDPSRGTVYHRDADRRSWGALRGFLEELF